MNACFFDMDGTLIDSRADLAATVNHTRRDFRLSELPLEEVLVHVGRGARYLMAHAIPEIEDFDSAIAVFRSHYAEHMLDTTVLYPGVKRTLETLRDRGWLLGVNTNKPGFATRAILEHFGLSGLFGRAVVAGGDCAELKPSALPLEVCSGLLDGHVLTASDWMVGDSWQDMDCAKNAGIKGAFCSFGFGQIAHATCSVRLKRFEDLLFCLKEGV